MNLIAEWDSFPMWWSNYSKEYGRTWEYNGMYYTIRWHDKSTFIGLSMGPNLFTLYSKPQRTVVSIRQSIASWFITGTKVDFDRYIANPEAVFAECIL